MYKTLHNQYFRDTLHGPTILQINADGFQFTKFNRNYGGNFESMTEYIGETLNVHVYCM